MTSSARRAARQHLRTGQLLGVAFAPLPSHTTAAPATTTPEPTPTALIEPKPTAQAPTTSAPSSPTPANPRAALDQLLERYTQDPSTAANLITGWTNIVFHDGDPTSPIMFIGEAPGADEDASGTPFVGRAGQKLNEMISAMGLARQSVYIANVLKVRPPNNRDPSRDETDADGPYLHEQIRIVNPRAIVTLGRPASQFILQSDLAMARLRGALHDYRGIPVAPTYHPAYLLRAYTPENRRKVWDDLQRAMAVLNQPAA